MTRYTNYVMKNNVFAELEAPIGSLATTIQLKEGQGARWGNEFPILATLENFDSNGKCTKREIVRITAVNGDNLTVVRGVAPCPSSDDSNTQGTSTYSFQADDKISLYITKEHFDNIEAGFENTNDEIDDLHDNGTDELRTYATTGLGVEIKPGKALVGTAYVEFEGGTLTLTNNATNYIEIDENGDLQVNTTGWTQDNGKVSKVTTSGGEITNIDDWRMAVVGGKIGQTNIHELTEKAPVSSLDEFIIADSDNLYQSKKVKACIFVQRPRFGDSSDGECIITQDTIMCAKEYNFTNFIICSGKKVYFCGNGIPIIRASGKICNLGQIHTQGYLGPNDQYMYSASGGEICVINNIGATSVGGGNGGGPSNCGGTTGGKGGDMGCAGNSSKYAGGQGGLYSGGGGGGGNANTCNECPSWIEEGTAGCDAPDDYTGGNGGKGRGKLAGGGGGGGGFGFCLGGTGGQGGRTCMSYGCGGCGGVGGGSFFCGGAGGEGGPGYYGGGGGQGGFSRYGTGGTGGQSGCSGQYGSYAGKGGDGYNGGQGGAGGYGYCGPGYGGAGGNSTVGMYGLGLFSRCIISCCINAKGGNGGNGGNLGTSTWIGGAIQGASGGNGGNGGEVHFIYDICLCHSNTNVSAGSGGAAGTGRNCAGCPGSPGTAGKVFEAKFIP